MTNPQLYGLALQKTWWLWLPIVLGIVGTGFKEMVEKKWETRSKKI